MDYGTIILLVLGYPFIAAWLVGIGRNRRLAALEDELAVLRGQIQGATLPASAGSPAEAVGDDARLWRASIPADSDGKATEDEYWLAQPAAPVAPEDESAAMPDDAVLAKVSGEPPQSQAHQDAAPGLAEWNSEAPADRWTAEAGDLAHSVALQASPNATAPGSSTTAGSTQDNPAGASGPVRASGRALSRWTAAAMGWLFSGNLVAKLGLLILFIGVGFLLKYVAESVFVPIELRLAAVVAANLALLGWGWRLRTSRRGIGLPVQGTAIAILMLVVFAAYHRYGLVSPAFAFALLTALTAFTCLLAVLQESAWLAAFGITGGFASPLLLATAEGQHVSLFSYYALLNTGVFALAIKRAWRPLNLLGFVFTFVVGSTWGGLYYDPENYLSAQSFLVLFFLMYVGIALGFARQQQTRLKDYVDATLVLGTPLLAFGLQSGLTKDQPFGIALSALALGSFYLILATALWRRGRERWRVLVETFLALGVIFGTLAIPFAVDGRWTSGVWALEGAGFVWFGLRRKQRLTWAFGILLQAGSWTGFIAAATGLDTDAARTSNLWLGFLLLAGSAFAIARGFRRHATDESPRLSQIGNWCLAIAAVWLLAGAWIEAILHTSGGLLANLLVASALLTAGLLYLSGARLAWPLARRLAMAAQIAGAVALLVVTISGWSSMGDGSEPLAGAFMIAIAALTTSCLSERTPDRQASRRFPHTLLLWGAAWWFGPALVIAADRMAALLADTFDAPYSFWTPTYALAAGASAAAFTWLAPRLNWTRLRWLGASSWGMLALVTLPMLAALYGRRTLPNPGEWLAWMAFWCSAEYTLARWTAADAPLNPAVLRGVHLVRTAGPWLALWPVGSILIERWLVGFGDTPGGTQQTNWATDAAWGNYLPTWAMMLVLAWLVRRSVAGRWPALSLAQWYRRFLIPSGALLILALAAVWNITQDGTMTPLPYLPLLNPLDLTTGFALALCLGVTRMSLTEQDGRGSQPRWQKIIGIAAAYVWFNLMLLRSAAQYRGIPYQLEALAASQFVQAMLSLVWCTSALLLMQFAARKAMRRSWCIGALLLGVVLLKLFTFDLANSGSLARVVSFVGVGLLTLMVGYLAPFPKAAREDATGAQSA